MANAVGAVVSLPSDKLLSTFNMWKPEVAQELYPVLGDQGLSTFRNLRNLGMVFPVAQDTRTTWSQDFIHQTIATGGAISTVSAPDGTYSFTLATASPNNSFLTSASTTPYSAATYYSPVQLNQRIAFPDGTPGGIPFTVYNITGTGTNAVTVFVKQADLNQTFTPGDFASGTELIISGNAWAEGTDQPDGVQTKPYEDTEYAQIIKTSYKISGTQMTNQLWFKPVTDANGSVIAYDIIGRKDAEYEHELAMCNALLFERVTTNPTFVGSNVEPNKTTEGLVPYAMRRGFTLPYTTGSFSPATFDLIDTYLESQFAPTYLQFMMGIDLDNEKDNAMKQYLQNTMQAYEDSKTVSDLFDNNPGLAIGVNFRLFKKGYRTYCMTRVPEFSNTKTWGAAGYNTKGLGVIVPIATQKDLKSGDKLPYFGMGYKALNGYSRMAEVWTTSGAGTEQKVVTGDYSQINHRSHIMACHVGGNQMVVLNRTA